MQTERNMKARNIAERFAPSPSRREVMAGAAVAVLGLGAAAVDTEATAGQDGAAALIEQWADATRAMLEAERDASKAMTAAEKEIFALPPVPEAPELPSPDQFASKEARADFRALTIGEGIGSEKARAILNRITESGLASPEYRKAMDAYHRQTEERNAALRAHQNTKRAIEKRHGFKSADDAHTRACHRKWEADRAVLNAPVNSERDALAVLTVILFAVDVSAGVFDGSTDEDFPKGVNTDAMLRRLRPFLPASPSSLPKHWNI